MPANPKLTAKPALPERWLASLPEAERTVIQRLIRLAEDAGVQLYLVGGPLRDLLLGRPSLDVDLAVEGDAITLATKAAAELNAKARTHAAFGTATLIVNARDPARAEVSKHRAEQSAAQPTLTVDIATARAETYERPGALPTVRRASIEDDLRRRDFTVNAMALRLTGPARGEVIDPFGGCEDLQAGLIRILHDRSFQDDATRILRAARYEARFGFRIDEQAVAALKRDLAYLGTISGARLRHELERILEEAEPERALLRLADLGALQAFQPTLAFSKEQAKTFTQLREATAGQGFTLTRGAYWGVLTSRLTEADAAALAARLSLTKPQRENVEAMPRLSALLPALQPDRRPSEMADLLSPFPPPAIWALATLSNPPLRDRLLDYVRRLRHLKPRLTGDDLIRMGLRPGPRLGDILARLRDAWLDGEVPNKRDEILLVREMVSKEADRKAPLPAHPARRPVRKVSKE